MRELSDHDLVKCELVVVPRTDTLQGGEKKKRSLASQINFKRANQEALDEKINQIDWDMVIDTPDPDQVSEAFTAACCQAALEVKTPKYKESGRKEGRHQLNAN